MTSIDIFVRCWPVGEVVIERHESFERDAEFQTVPEIATDLEKTVVGPEVRPLKAENYQLARYRLPCFDQ